MEEERVGLSPHVAILSSPGMGHLIPLAELAKRLVLNHNFTVTIITYSDFSSTSQQSFLSSLPPGLSSLSLPPVSLADLPSDARIETRISVIIARSVSPLKNILQTLKKSTNLVSYVIDLFGGDTLAAAKELNVPRYMFFTSTFMTLSFMFYLPTLHETTSCEFRDLPEPLKLPGCVPLWGEDFLDPIQDRTNEVYLRIVHMAKRFRETDGIIVNSFEAMEPDAAKVLSDKENGRPPVYPVGPIVRSGSSGGGHGFECLKWLDEQPRGSVLFISFGSGGTLSYNQVKELAFGLEMSGQRFLWVVRTPSDYEASATFFSHGSNNDDPLEFLPDGFLSRTKKLGLVVPNWAPQMEVLSHVSTGGFLTHCGWNSTLESVVNGVPMIAWPLYAEQRMNAVMLVEGVKVALRPLVGEKGLVGREEICKVVKELMEEDVGKAVRDRARELQAAGTEALSVEGSSYRALAEVANKWKG